MYSPPARGLPIHCGCLSADAGAGGRMWLEARRLARGDCVELKNPFPPNAPRAIFLQYKHKRFRSILRTILSKPGKTSIHTCLGAGAGATLLASTYTYTPNIRIQLPPSRQIFSKTHIWGWGWGWGLGLGPLFDTPSYSTSKMKASRPQKSINSLSKTIDFEVIKGGSDPTPYHPSTDLGAGEE